MKAEIGSALALRGREGRGAGEWPELPERRVWEIQTRFLSRVGGGVHREGRGPRIGFHSRRALGRCGPRSREGGFASPPTPEGVGPSAAAPSRRG